MKSIKYYMSPMLLAALLLSGNAAASDAFEGYKLYKSYCMVCHGVEGQGDGPLASKLGGSSPADLTNAAHVGKRSDKELFQIIQGTADHAEIDGKMPRWGLAISGPQIKSLVAYIRFLHESNHNVLGDPELGKQIYLKSCAACHGPSGKGDGVMTNVLDMQPADHTKSGSMGAVSNERLLEVVRNGGNGYMPAWKGILSDEEITAVVGYIRLLSY
ncbi:MAG: c-type cytochrome [Pseudomonadota bacterium]